MASVEKRHRCLWYTVKPERYVPSTELDPGVCDQKGIMTRSVCMHFNAGHLWLCPFQVPQKNPAEDCGGQWKGMITEPEWLHYGR